MGYGVVAFLFVSCSTLFWLSSNKSKTGMLKFPPEAGGERPFTGHFHLMVATPLPDFLTSTGSLADKYVPIFTIRLGVRRALVVSSWELTKEIFTTYDAVVSSRPKLRSGKHLCYDYACSPSPPYGAYWRQLRKLVSVELQSNVRVLETAQSIKELYNLWEDKNDGLGPILVDMKQWLGDLNLNVILKVVAGKKFRSEDDALEMGWCREVMKEFFHLAGMFLPADALPYLGLLDLGGHEKRMKKTGKEFDEIVGGWLAEHRGKECSSKAKQQDFMDVMLVIVS